MPIAESSAPIVVGIRQTRSATSTIDRLARRPSRSRTAGASRRRARKMIVSPASRMSSAISFGVLLAARRPRRARSCGRGTISPGFAVTSTTIWSERTRVPPVTAERSPPDSRITGADSPVIADSSTVAMPSITSPSAGIRSPGRDDDDVAGDELRARHLDDRAVGLALAGERLRARACAASSAWALPAPLRHRLGEVGEEHGEPEPGRDQPGEDVLLGGRVAEVLDEEDGHDDAPDLDEEHHGVARDVARVELAERGRARPLRTIAGSNREVGLLGHSCRCSRIGPSASVGR